MSQGFYGFPRILDIVRATTFKALGKAGATNGAALAGGTASGAPTSGGPFDVGDLIVDATGKLWVCTTAGTSQSSPGSFTQVAGATSPLSTKGDVWVYGSADARLGVGSDTQVLTADSTQTLGLKWAASAGGGAQLYTLTTPPTSSSWTWVNQGSSTVTDQQSGLTLANASSDSQWHLLVMTAPSTPYTITAAFLVLWLGNASDAVGLCFRASGAGTIHGLEASANGPLYSRKLNSATSFSADYSSAVTWKTVLPTSALLWLQISDDGANRITRYSADGQYWQQYTTIGRTDFLTANQVGFYVRPGDTVAATLISWKQT